jgi:superfamily I DNA/RNA helicase
MEIIRHLLDKLDNSSPLISWGDRYTNQKKISDNIQIVKRENFTPAALEVLVADQEIFYSSAATLIARLSEIRATKNNYSLLSSILNELLSAPYLSPALQLSLKFAIDSTLNLSEVKTKVKKIHQDLEKDIPRQKEFISIYRQYQQELSSRHRYDYEDMILHTLSALRENSSLLLSCQEKYQYILVDEYQDTNSSQNSLLDLLSSNQLRPNLFVVGDDDQSIYRFQGASVENIVKFYQQYQPHIVVLVNNYRSHRLILASSASVIANNKNRIARYQEWSRAVKQVMLH